MSYIAVIYDSKYGSSKQYATWIAQSLNADLMMKKQVKWLNIAQKTGKRGY